MYCVIENEINIASGHQECGRRATRSRVEVAPKQAALLVVPVADSPHLHMGLRRPANISRRPERSMDHRSATAVCIISAIKAAVVVVSRRVGDDDRRASGNSKLASVSLTDHKRHLDLLPQLFQSTSTTRDSRWHFIY